MLAVTVVAAVMSLQAAPPPAPEPARVMVPLAGWEPKAGASAEVYAGGGKSAACAATMLEMSELEKLIYAGDRLGLQKMLDAGRAFTVPAGTPLLVLAVHDNPLLTKLPVVEARLTGGGRKGEKVYVHAQRVALMVPAPPPPAEAPAAKPTPEQLAREAEARAGTLLKSARNLEAAGKRGGAMTFYRRVLKEYPKTGAARAAADRVKAIGGP